MELNLLHKGLTYDEYASTAKELKALRSSMLRPLMKSAAHLRASMQNEKKETEALRQGKIIHSLFENPERFMDSYKVEPIFEGRTKKGELTTNPNCTEVREAKADWYARLPKTAIVLEPHDVDMVNGIWATLQTKTQIRNLLRDGVNETSLFTKDPETGVYLACRHDFISAKAFPVDLKTCRDAYAHPLTGEGPFYDQIFNSRRDNPFYVLNAAHYAHCFKVSGCGRSDTFSFVAFEKEPPYEMNLFPLDAGCLDAGERWRKALTRTYAKCLETDKWPGYANRAIPVMVPQWVAVPPEEEHDQQ